MSRITALLRLATLCVILLCPTIAAAQDWIVARTTKQVNYTVDKTMWHAVEKGAVIPNEAWISTGPRGRVTLERGTERISLSPNTLGAIITTQSLFSRKTEVLQQVGEIALDIEKRNTPHTAVHTPFLAAVVKGTSFTVTVTAEDASLSVQEGLVEVSSFTGGQSTQVGPGQQVTVDQSQTMSVAGLNAAPSIASVAPTPASIAAVGQVSPIGVDAADRSQSNQSTRGAEANSSGSTSSSSSDSSSRKSGSDEGTIGGGSSISDRNGGKADSVEAGDRNGKGERGGRGKADKDKHDRADKDRPGKGPDKHDDGKGFERGQVGKPDKNHDGKADKDKESKGSEKGKGGKGKNGKDSRDRD